MGNRKILCWLHPLIREQQIYIYQDGLRLFSENVNLDNLIPAIFEKISEYDTFDIELMGPKDFSTGIERQIRKANTYNYNLNIRTH